MIVRRTATLPTLFAPSSIATWHGRTARTLASEPAKVTITHDMAHRFNSHPLSRWVGPMELRADAGTEARLTRHAASANLQDPVLTLSFSRPVRLAKDVLPAAAAWGPGRWLGSGWMFGEWGLGIKRMVLDGQGRLTLDTESNGVVLPTLLAGVDNGAQLWRGGQAVARATLAGAGQMYRQVYQASAGMASRALKSTPRAASAPNLRGLAASSADSTDSIDSADSSVSADAVATQRSTFDTALFFGVVDALMPQTALSQAPLSGVAVTSRIGSTDRFSMRVRGDLDRVLGEHPRVRAAVNHPLTQALLPPVLTASSTPRSASSSYGVEVAAAYAEGAARIDVAAYPKTAGLPAWDAMATLSAPKGKEISVQRALALASRPTRVPSVDGPVGVSAPQAALVHGFDTAFLHAHAAPLAPPPPTLPALPTQDLPECIEKPLLDVLRAARLQASAPLRAGVYSTDSWLSKSRLVVPGDGEFQMTLETQPAATADASQVRLQRAALRWSGDKPLVWQLGFMQHVWGSAVGRFLDSIFHVRLRGIYIDATGSLNMDGHVYLLGMRLISIDTVLQWAARWWPTSCPAPRLETDASQWLRGEFFQTANETSDDATDETQPALASSDALWQKWRELRAMNLGFNFDLAPLNNDHLHVDLGSVGHVASAPLEGRVRLTDAGDLQVDITGQGGANAAFTSSGAMGAMSGTWALHLDRHMFASPQGADASMPLPSAVKTAYALDLTLVGETSADARIQLMLEAARPRDVRAEVAGSLRLGGVAVQGSLQASGHLGENQAGFVLDSSAWSLAKDVSWGTATLQAGHGGFFTHLTAPQRLHLQNLRAQGRQSIA